MDIDTDSEKDFRHRSIINTAAPRSMLKPTALIARSTVGTSWGALELIIDMHGFALDFLQVLHDVPDLVLVNCRSFSTALELWASSPYLRPVRWAPVQGKRGREAMQIPGARSPIVILGDPWHVPTYHYVLSGFVIYRLHCHGDPEAPLQGFHGLQGRLQGELQGGLHGPPWPTLTTLMLTGLRPNLTLPEVLRVLKTLGISPFLDFVFLTVHTGKLFLNFRRSEDAMKAWCEDSRGIRLSWAKRQGLGSNIRTLRRSKLNAGRSVVLR